MRPPRGARAATVALATVALLVSGSACRDRGAKPRITAKALADSADQVMFGAHFNLTDQGVLRANLLADTALFFDDNTRIELLHVNTTFYTPTGAKNAVLTSRRGTYRTNSGEMTALGDVHVDSEDGRRLRTQQLTYAPNRNEIASDSAFLLTDPNRRLEGIGFRSDPNLQHVRVLNTLSGTTGTLSLPHQ